MFGTSNNTTAKLFINLKKQDANNFHYNFQTFANNNWVNVSNTLTETLFNSATSAANKAFAAFITGTRIIANQTPPNYNNVTLSAIGNLQTGTQTFSNTVVAGDNTFIGSGSVIANNVNIADNIIIGAGSLVLNDLVQPGVYAGSPAKRIKDEQ